MNLPLGLLFASCTIACFSISTILSKLIMSNHPVWLLLFFRFGIGAVTLIWFARKQLGQLSVKDQLPLLAYAMTAVTAVCFFILAINFSFPGKVSIISAISPLFVALLAYRFLGEQIQRSFYLWMVIILTGLLMIVQPISWNNILIGDLFALVSTMLTAICMVSLRTLSHRYPSIIIYSYICMVGAVVTAPVLLHSGLGELNANSCLLLIVNALIIIVSELCFIRSMQYLPALVGSVVYLLAIPLNYLSGIVLFGEPITRFEIVGIMLVVFGISCICSNSKQPIETILPR